MINYIACNPVPAEGIRVSEFSIERGTCTPESMAAVALVHYPVQEGWQVNFRIEESEEDA